MVNVGVVFGGQSPEHEVSVITSLQAAAVINRSRYYPIPIYIAKNGRWYTGEFLLDIANYKDIEKLLSDAIPIKLVPSGDERLVVEPDVRQGIFGRRSLVKKIDVAFIS